MCEIGKQCIKCGILKPMHEFYTHTMMQDGHLNKCKSCCKKDARVNYRKNHDHYIQYEKQRRTTEERKKKAISNCKRIRAQHPEKYKAHQLVHAAKTNGTLKQMPCEICGTPRTYAHHEDYSKPLDVIWLCPLHHKWIHS